DALPICGTGLEIVLIPEVTRDQRQDGARRQCDLLQPGDAAERLQEFIRVLRSILAFEGQAALDGPRLLALQTFDRRRLDAQLAGIRRAVTLVRMETG